MTTVAKDAALDEQRAWRDYADRLRGLEGAEYEHAEEDAWEDLQAALDMLRTDAVSSSRSVG